MREFVICFTGYKPMEKGDMFHGKYWSFDTIMDSPNTSEPHILLRILLKFVEHKKLEYASYPTVFILYIPIKEVITPSLIQKISSFYKESKYADLLMKEAWKIEEEERKRRRKSEGFVIINSFPNSYLELSGDLHPDIVKANHNYIAGGSCWGYIGALERMYKHDEWLTQLYDVSTVDVKKKICDFVNHSDARYFMNGITPKMDKEEFIIGVTKTIKRKEKI